jgi:hypothetical protein
MGFKFHVSGFTLACVAAALLALGHAACGERDAGPLTPQEAAAYRKQFEELLAVEAQERDVYVKMVKRLKDFDRRYTAKYGPPDAPLLTLAPDARIAPVPYDTPRLGRVADQQAHFDRTVRMTVAARALAANLDGASAKKQQLPALDAFLDQWSLRGKRFVCRGEPAITLNGPADALKLAQYLAKQDLYYATRGRCVFALDALRYYTLLEDVTRQHPDLAKPVTSAAKFTMFDAPLRRILRGYPEHFAKVVIHGDQSAFTDSMSGRAEEHIAAAHDAVKDSIECWSKPLVNLALDFPHEAGHAVSRIQEDEMCGDLRRAETLLPKLDALTDKLKRCAALARALKDGGDAQNTAEFHASLREMKAAMDEVRTLRRQFQSMYFFLEESVAYLFQQALLHAVARDDPRLTVLLALSAYENWLSADPLRAAAYEFARGLEQSSDALTAFRTVDGLRDLGAYVKRINECLAANRAFVVPAGTGDEIERRLAEARKGSSAAARIAAQDAALAKELNEYFAAHGGK